MNTADWKQKKITELTNADIPSDIGYEQAKRIIWAAYWKYEAEENDKEEIPYTFAGWLEHIVP
tara:strand:+ start:6760 stop:6948 length:189 start_codon:yes stop_codon:yes gene_type:complete